MICVLIERFLPWLFSLCVGCLGLGIGAARADADPVTLGVLALRGPDKAVEMWSATAGYLERSLPGHRFKVQPLGFDEVRLAVRQGRVDFVLTNSSYFVELESLYGVSAIATLKNRFDGGPGFSQFGGVILTRADRQDIRTLADLKGKTFAAVDASSFGGWQVGWREMLHQRIDPERDLKRLEFLGTHDAVAYAVRDGKVDAGTLRTDTLERMAAEGKLTLSDFYILNPQRSEGFPLLLSTVLYPEWPLAKLRHVPDDLAVQVAIALMQMPSDDPAALAGQITGWTLPLNYQPVHDALRELRIGPYESLRRLTPAEVVAQYGPWLGLGAVLILASLVTLGYIGRINRRLRQNQSALTDLNATLETRIQARTGEVEKLLEREHFQRGVVEMVADVNQILITSASKEEMLKAACDRLVARGEYRFAWVGLLTEGALEVASRSYGAADYMRGVTACLDQRATQECLALNRAVVETAPDSLGPELVQAGIRALIVLPLRQDAFARPLGVLGVMTPRPDAFDAEESAMLEQLAGDLGFGIHAFDQRKETRRLQLERISNYEETILSLVDMIEKRDTYTAGHTRRVARYCELIARKLDLPDAEVEKLKRAAILHDIGKIAIPDAVLLKPGKLTPLEYELIKQHAEEGYRTLIRIDMYKELAEIMRYHHERENGTGYPHGLADGEIPRLSQIMAVADAFDAMTTNRIYKPRKEVALALEELRALAGEQFAADVVEAACEVLRDVQPPSVSDQLPKTPLERQRFAYFFDDPLTGAHNGHYLQLMLRNGLPDRLRHAYLIQLRQFTRLNLRVGWAGGNQVLADFAAHLARHYPDAVLFRVMGDDFVLLAPRPLVLDATGLVERTPLAGTEVTVEVREIDPRGPERDGLLDLL